MEATETDRRYKVKNKREGKNKDGTTREGG